ncbi:MAG: hypothetical protein ABIP46_02765 [Polaromonas sp.]
MPTWLAVVAPLLRIVLRTVLLSLVGLSLLAGLAGGLWRAGVSLPTPADAAWPGRALLAHAALMICGFLGTVIGIERAVAVKLRAAFAAPLASGLGSVCLVLGQAQAGAWLGVAAAAAFVAVNGVVVKRQRAPHTLLLLAGAGAWLAGNLLFAFAPGSAAALPWWFAFLVMTIAAERLEMTRLMRRRPGAQPSLMAVLSALPLGAAVSAVSPVAGGLLFGASLALLALWLAVFDIARRTVLAHGLSRYMAVCLLGGYVWLAVAGLAWAGTAVGLPLRDAALHALGLGFIVSMMMGHAPVILPAVARVKLQFGLYFYVPLALLHLSLIVRLGFGLTDASLRAVGATLNAAALAVFALTVAGAALAWRFHNGPPHRMQPRKNPS